MKASAARVARAIQLRVEETRTAIDGAAVPTPISLSIGIAVFPDDSQKALELLAHADSNLYQAKFGRKTVIGRERRAPLSVNDTSFSVLDAMITAIDNKDRYTRCHSEAVAEYAGWLCDALGLSEARCARIREAALLHDLGKIGVPDEILHKTGILEPQEFETMRRHPVTGALIVGAMPGFAELAPGIRAHHERWDGRGYPDALAGEAIAFEGRLLALADSLDAMTTDRPYRRRRTWDEALAEIEAGAGTHFDPRLAALFIVTARQKAQRRQAA